MGAGLEREIERTAAGALPRFAEGKRFGVGSSGALVPAAPGDVSPGVENDSADHRIGAGAAQSPGRERERLAHNLVAAFSTGGHVFSREESKA